MSFVEKERHRETSQDSLPSIIKKQNSPGLHSERSGSFKQSFLSSKSQKNIKIFRSSEEASLMSLIAKGKNEEELVMFKSKRSSMPIVQTSRSNVYLSPSRVREFTDEGQHSSSIFDKSYKRLETATESNSQFYTSFEPVYTQKMELLNSHHKKTMSVERWKEYTYLKALAREKLTTLLKENLELPNEEVTKLMHAKNPFSAAFDYQIRHKQELVISNQPRIL
jgi:hypothetical protein